MYVLVRTIRAIITHMAILTDLRNLLFLPSPGAHHIASIIGQRTGTYLGGFLWSVCVWCVVFTPAYDRNATLHGPSSSAHDYTPAISLEALFSCRYTAALSAQVPAASDIRLLLS